MRIWKEIEQRQVYHEMWGWGIATAESNDGYLYIHFDSDPWFPKTMRVDEVE